MERTYAASTMNDITSEAHRNGILYREKIYHYIAQARQGDKEAEEQIVSHNYLLVLKIAKGYERNLNHLTIEDLFDEGILGLYKAIERFDLSSGYEFSTYATNWIKFYMRKAIQRDRTIMIPNSLYGDLTKIKRAMEKYNTDKIETIAELTGLSAKRVRSVLKETQKPISLYAPIMQGDEGEVLLFERLEDDSFYAKPDYIAEENDEKERIRKAINRLTPKQKAVIRMRFGFDGGEPMTLQQVGDHLDMTREGIRKVEQKALAKLKKELRYVV